MKREPFSNDAYRREHSIHIWHVSNCGLNWRCIVCKVKFTRNNPHYVNPQDWELLRHHIPKYCRDVVTQEVMES